MAQLNFQLSTASARAELAALDRSLEGFKAKLASFSSAKGFENSLAKLSAFKGIEANAIASLDRLASALSRTQRLSDLSAISKGLNSLARVRVDAVAANLDKMSRALAGFRVPPSMARFATDLAKIASSAGLAANGIQRVSRALGTIRAAPGLSSTARSFERINSSASSAATGLYGFGRAGSLVSSTMAGFGVILGAAGFARFISGSLEAVTAVDAFTNSVAATQGGMAAANAEWNFAKGVATDLKISIEGVAASYGSFSAAASLAGVSTENIHTIFRSMSEAARVLNMDSTKVENSFKALEQMFSKGTVGAEELRQQLGDALPGAMQLMAQAVGVSTGELMEMMKAGQVLSASALPKFADVLHQKFGGQVPAALQTAGAAMQNFSNAVFNISEAFGRGLFGDEFRASLDGIANALNDPAFIAGARVWGTAIGSTASAATTAVKFLADNFDLLKYAALGVIGLRVGAGVAGWAQSFSLAGSAAVETTRIVAGMPVVIGRLGMGAGIISGLRGAFLAAAFGARAFVAALGPIGLAVVALSIGVPLAIELYQKWTASADQTAHANADAASQANALADGATDVARASMSAASGLNSGAAAASNLGSGFDRSATSAHHAASAYREAAAAAASIPRLSGGNAVNIPGGADSRDLPGHTLADFFSGGGISHRGSGRKHFVPTSIFTNAPRFADGGITGGGIPAVLHPNEAVVPLAGGGTIPVQMMSSGQGSLLLLKPLQQLVDYQKQTKTEVARVWEATTVQSVLMKNAFDRVEGVLNHIDNVRLADLSNNTINIIKGLDSVRAAVANIQISYGGGGGDFGGGGGGGGSATNSVADQVIALLKAQEAQIALNAASTSNAGSGQMGLVGGIAVALGSKKYWELTLPIVQAANELFAARIRAGLISDAELQKTLENLRRGKGGYAVGSPNASRDASGGFTAILHPDEAVIPLPDGRSVPVTFQSGLLDRLERFMDQGNTRVMGAARSESLRGRGAGITVNAPINITIHAKDADSFRASKDQIAREVQKGLDRAIRTIGRQSDIDDPTRRV